MRNLIPENLKDANGIYRILNLTTGTCYIGKTEEGFQKRYRRHLNMLENGKHFNQYLQNSFNDSCSDNFSFSIIYVLQAGESIDDCERGFIFTFRSAGECYNFCAGGEGMSGENNPFFGHHHSEEFKKAQSERQKADPRNKGENNNFYGKDHSGKNNGFYGHSHSEESKRSMSETKKQKAIDDENYHQQLVEKSKRGAAKAAKLRQKRVLCVELNMEFDSIKEASEYTEAPRAKISMVCAGKRNTAGGYHWRYI